jgi:CHAT domain-containing protein
MHNLGALYQSVGNFDSARQLMERSVALSEKNQGPDNPDLASFLLNLGRLYVARGELEQAEAPYQRSLAIREKLMKPDASGIAAVHSALAAMYQEWADLPKAEASYARALAIYQKGNAPADTIATTMHNLAVLHVLQRDYDTADAQFARVLEIRRTVLGPWHPSVASTLEAVMILNWVRGRPNDAARSEREANEIFDRHLTNVLAVGSERQKLLFVETLRENTDITMTLRSKLAEPTLAELAATTVLRRKGRVLDAMVDTMAAASRTASDADRALLTRLSAARTEIGTLALQLPAPGSDVAERKRHLEALDTEVQSIESRLSQQGAAVRAESRSLTISDITSRLPADGALVDYVQYRPFDEWAVGRRGRFGQPRYAAMILRQGAAPAWVELGETAVVDKAIGDWRVALARRSSTDVDKLGREVDKLVFEPLETQIGKSARVLIAPDGALSLVPFAALVGPAGRHRLESLEIVLLSSGRDVVRLAAASSSMGPALVIADPAFDAGGKPSPTEGFGFSRLPGTAEEAKALAALMPKATIVTGAEATEARLKAAQHPGVLHVATHGFFFGRTEGKPAGVETRGLTSRPVTSAGSSSDALVRSGRARAGATQPAVGGKDDGLLTAVEAASLDLAGTQLVVLSACETGVGEVRTGEGVQGLRRAFAVAGAASQVMSLWQVDDQATRELMTDYYRDLLAGKGRAAALRDVQLAMQRRAGRAHPYYWAAFVFAGSWAPLPDLSALR